MEHLIANVDHPNCTAGPNLQDWHEMSWFDAASLHAKYPGKYGIQIRKRTDTYIGSWVTAEGVFTADSSWNYRAKLVEEPVEYITITIPKPRTVYAETKPLCETEQCLFVFKNNAERNKAYEAYREAINK